jgi:NAD-dependent SIR2 family protein deacetylase
MEEEIRALREDLGKAEINLERTPNSDRMDYALQGKAGDIVPKLVEGGA